MPKLYANKLYALRSPEMCDIVQMGPTWDLVSYVDWNKNELKLLLFKSAEEAYTAYHDFAANQRHEGHKDNCPRCAV